MAPTTFNDGDPIDAATLQSLVTEIATLRSSIPNITTAGTKIELSGKTGVADIVIPQIYGGRSEKITLSAGKWKPFTINYKDKFTSVPKAVVLTPYVTGTSDNRLTYEAQVTKIGKDSAECKVRGVGSPASLGSGDIYMSFIVIQNA